MDFDFSETIVLQNSRVVLRPMSLDDKIHLQKTATLHDDLVLYSPYQIHTNEFLEDFVVASLAEREKLFRYPFTIFDKQAGEFAGSTSIANISNKDQRFEIGWTWIGKQF